MDVQTVQLTAKWRATGITVVLLAGLLLRLHGFHNPVLDHPGWRQGDEASIARNFATLRYNIFYPQTNYDGPPPNYVELELQLVPFIAATAYKIVGVHEIIGRVVTLAFSLGAILILGFFGRWLFTSAVAGLLSALFFAIAPGSIYYGRTFTPDTTMVFFMCAALYVNARLLLDREAWHWRMVLCCVVLTTLALLAKPVAIIMLVPVVVLLFERYFSGRSFRIVPATALIVVPLAVLYAYDAFVSAHAEWHWTSGITKLHVMPALRAALGGGAPLAIKWAQFRVMLGVLARLMIGPAITALAILGFLLPARVMRSRSLLWSWLLAGLAYVFVVVTVQRVDYYLLPLLPLATLAAAGFSWRLILAGAQSALPRSAKYAGAGLAFMGILAIVYQNRAIVQPYYAYSKQVYRNATTLDKTLARNALVVMGHYDPSVLYYIGRYGWEEDPYLWTPFDEQSAIRKGARYFIAIEKNRFNRNLELCAWMQRFPVMNPNARWPVYLTDPAHVKSGAEKAWRAFRNAEKVGNGRAWLDAHGLCR